MIRTVWPIALLPSLFLASVPSRALPGEEPPRRANIHIDASISSGRVSRYLAGACIEDVNHEIYGGLYSQMIFGESFQEPPVSSPIKDFRAWGGKWRLKNEELWAEGLDGPKLVSEHLPFFDGEVGVEIFLPDRHAGNAGLIVRVDQPAVGANRFAGYEISLDAQANVVRLGRHRHDWELIKDTPYPVPIGRWIPLVVKMKGKTLEVLVSGKSVIRHTDGARALLAGTVGLRPWQREARFRDMWIRTGEKTTALPFIRAEDAPSEISGMWRAVRKGTAQGRWSLVADRPLVGVQSQTLSYVSGEGEIGVENQGLNRWGLSVGAHKSYEGHVWLRAEKPVEMFFALESKDGARVHDEAKLAVAAGDWRRVNFTLTPRLTDPAARFTLKLKGPGSVALGYVLLQPGPWGRFKGLPVRRDVAEGMIDMGLTVLRYGGSMVNAAEYRWKKMIGPRDFRPPYKGEWYPCSTNGWGIIDFLDFCEAARFLPIPAFNADETAQDMADFVAYVNSPADSVWGKKRAADGHPAPYRLKHLEFGNEERVDAHYAKRFKAVAEAVWAADPEIVLVVGDFVYGRPVTDPDRVTGAASGITSLAAHREILNLARQHGREVWFDIHIGTEHPAALQELAVVPTYVDALAKLAAGTRHRVVIFELNSGNHSQRRALANAIALGALQPLGDRLPVVCSANGLQPDGQNDNGWDQGLLFLSPTQVWLQPPGYVTRMIARSYQPNAVQSSLQGNVDYLRVAAAKSADGRVLVLRVVNPGSAAVAASVSIAGFLPIRSTAKVEELAGPMDAANTAQQPRRITPRSSQWQHGLPGHLSDYTFAPHSFTLLTFE